MSEPKKSVDLVSLPGLAVAIEREHEAASTAARRALQHVLECGRLLLRAKALLPRGDWLPWLAGNCTLKPRTAQAYMRLARELPKLAEANAQRVADLSVRDAIAALATTSRQMTTLPEPAVAQVLRQAEDAPLKHALAGPLNHERYRENLMRQQHLIAAGKAPTDQTMWQEPERPARPTLPDPALVEAIGEVIERAGGPSFEALLSLEQVTRWVCATLWARQYAERAFARGSVREH